MDSEYDFAEFVQTLKNLSRPEIEVKVRSKHTEMRRLSEVRSRKKSHGVEVRNLAAGMKARMSDIQWWLGTGTRPGSMPLNDFLRLEPICKALIERGELMSSALDVFTQARAERAR